jgi:hypothetical protein
VADNVIANAGAGGATFAADDIAGVHFPRSKITLGADGVNDGDVSSANPMPTTVSGAALTALQLIDDVVYVDDAVWTNNTSKHVLLGGLYQSVDQTVTDGSVAPLQINAQGILQVDCPNTVFVNETGPALASLQLLDDAIYAEDVAAQAADKGIAILAVRRDTASTMVGADNDYTNLIVNGSGMLHVAEGGPALTSLQLIDDAIFADDAVFTQGTSRLMVVGFIADETATDDVQEHDVGVPRMTLDRKQIVVPQPHTAGGLTIFRSLDLDETEEEVKATAGCVYSMWVTNTATSTRFVKFYNATAANVTVGTTTPVITIGIPGNSSDDISGNFGPGGMGITFDTAICVAATTGVADNDTGAPGANEVIVNIFYK